MKAIHFAMAGILGLAGTGGAEGVAPETAPAGARTAPGRPVIARMDDAKYHDWLSRWEKSITADARNRYCDKAMGEDIGWLMTPFLDGFYYGYEATGQTKWVDLLVDWADSWVKRGVKEPDGFVGWPKAEAAGTQVDALNGFTADSLLGEAMVLRPIVLMAGEILRTPALKDKYGIKAESYLELSKRTYEKWSRRGAWRDTKDGGQISIVLPYGIDAKTKQWTDGYERRNDSHVGFSHPDNKANLVAQWLLAMADATGEAKYQEQAAKWFKLMKSRMKLRDDGTFAIWNYWEPAGEWDYKPDSSTKHWVGVHPNGGYYVIDTEAIVDAYEHGLVFTVEDIRRLAATGLAEKRYWPGLVAYSPEIRQHFEEELKPDSWGGLGETPRYLAMQRGGRAANDRPLRK